MKALVFDSALRLEPHHPAPPRADGDTLLRVRQAGVCSTDLEICKGYMGFRGVLGHEFVADVVESSDASLIGKRVVAEINCVCGTCERCESGLSNHCANRSVIGILNHGGAFAELLRVPAINCHVVPDGVDDDRAVFVEPLAAAFQILRQVRVNDRTRVTVLGGGRLGLLCAQVLRNAGADVLVVGRNATTLSLCERWQIRSKLVKDVAPKHDQDVVVDCTGTADGLETAIAMVRPRGTIVLKSTVAVGASLNLAPIVIDEITLIGSRCGPFPAAIDALARGEVDVLPMIHRRFRLDEAVHAMEVAAQRGVLKVMLMMPGT